MLVGMALLRSTALDDAGFVHAFPERTATQAELLALLEVTEIAQAKQVHGAGVIEAREASGADGREADAVVARASRPGIAVGVRVADCVPLLVADEASGDVAAIHAGWRGVVGGVVPAGIEFLAGRRGRARLIAAIGPCIGGCCFEVGQDVAASVVRSSPGATVLADDRGDKCRVDLRAAVRAQLLAAGVSAGRIDDVPGCTRHEADRFHSFRRDGASSGRMLAVIKTRASRPNE
jgi:YfiH family protein